jgi:hypothetical protein
MAVRIATVVSVVAAMLAVSGPAAAERGHRGATTFEGSCEFSGLLRQSPPLTNLPQPGTATAGAVGTCTGTLTDAKGRVRELTASRSSYFARARGTMGCGGGTAAGQGFIRLAGKTLRFDFSEVRGPGAGAITLDGAAGGSAAGVATVSEEEDPLEIAEKCSGEGLREARIDITIETTPAMSG